LLKLYIADILHGYFTSRCNSPADSPALE